MASSRKSNLADTVAARLAPLLPRHSSILIGLSGGMDSVVLLHLLHSLAPRFEWHLSALHVHHGISSNADAWADFCAGLCARYRIPLQVERVDIAPLRDAHGIEAAARRLRHAAFARQSCDFVALAHHADDQAETLLLQLLRGSGVKGAAAMPALSFVEGHGDAGPKGASTGSARAESKNICARSIVRPLLHCSRQEILDYAAAHELRWIEDESNDDDSYPRNFLRHRVLPLLEERFPACRDTLARSARHFAEASELLDDLARLDAPDLFHSPSMGEAWPVLSLSKEGEGGPYMETSRLQSLTQPRAKNLLRWFLHSLGAPMPHLAED